MAKFLGKFDIASFEELTGSAVFNSRRQLITNKQRIPFKLIRGDQSKGFKKADVQPTSTGAPIIVKLDGNINYLALSKAAYQSRLERQLQTEISGASDRRGTVIPSTLYDTIRAQIVSKLVQVPAIVMILAEDTPFTGSYDIISGSEPVYSGIANTSGYLDRTITNDSPTATGATWSFANLESTYVDGANGNQFHQSEYTASFIIRTYTSASYTGSYLNQVGARIDSGKFEYYTSSIGQSTAGFNRTVLSANVFGDGDYETFNASFNEPTSSLYAAPRELLTFPYDTVVASGSFFFSPSFETLVAATTPGQDGYQPIHQITLYWASGSGGLMGPKGLSGSMTPNETIPDPDAAANMPSGSHIFLNAKLSAPASGGYYSTDTLVSYPATQSFDGSLVGGFHISGTVHVAGDGMRGTSTPGLLYFANPFASAHTVTSSIITAAPRWNGISFTLSS